MRKAAWGLLLLFVFAIPWGTRWTWANPSATLPAWRGWCCWWWRFRRFCRRDACVRRGAAVGGAGVLSVVLLHLFLGPSSRWRRWTKLRANFQVMMVVWLVWEFAESPGDLRWLLRAFVAGSWVLAALTLIDFGSAEAIAVEHIRFAAYGQDPNDVARIWILGFRWRLCF